MDYFREKTGKRPSVRINNPDVLLNIHIAQTTCTLSLDSSGESLHRRGYRQEAVEAPLNEVLAAGMILMTGWRGECDLIDPMCGSGTIPVEAALIAKNIAPGVFRYGFAFEKWVVFDADMFVETTVRWWVSAITWPRKRRRKPNLRSDTGYPKPPRPRKRRNKLNPRSGTG